MLFGSCSWSLAVWILAQANLPVLPSDSVLRLVDGSGIIRLTFRNSSEFALRDLRLNIGSPEPLKVRVSPAQIKGCLPAERCAFVLRAEVLPKTPEKRFLIDLRLSADGFETGLHRSRLLVDASPRASQANQGWMDAGSIRVGGRSKSSRVLVLTLLSVVPVLILLGLGILFKRRARGSP